MTRNQWIIRNVDKETRHKIKVYAAKKNLTLAQAIRRLIILAEEAS